MDKTIPDTPRKLDPERTFDAIVEWIANTCREERTPGLIVGLSGTDSILTFLACARALERLGMPERLVGVNFEHGSKNEFNGAGTAFTCVKSDFNWVANDIFPWLVKQAPKAVLEVDRSIPHSDDNKRWGALLSRAIAGTGHRQGLLSNHFFPVGTRNATEEALGSYSQISKSVSMQPIIRLFKSEVLEICAHLGVPQVAIDKSRDVDCDCGRFDTQARYMRELDLFVMCKLGLLSRAGLEKIVPPEALNAVTEFYVEETSANEFRRHTPYIPSKNLAVVMT